MPTYPLAYRITDFLHRQIQWTQRVLAELDGAESAGDDDLDPFLECQKVREREAREMAREYNGLRYEWRQELDNVDREERDAIRALSQRAEELTAALRRRYAEAQQSADSRARAKQKALNDLRRGRRSVTIYRPEMLVSPEFIDKKA